MSRAGAAGRHAEALAMHRRLMPLIDLCFAETNPGPIKSVWDLIGVDAPHVLTPLEPSEINLTARLRAELTSLLKEERSMPALDFELG